MGFLERAFKLSANGPDIKTEFHGVDSGFSDDCSHPSFHQYHRGDRAWLHLFRVAQTGKPAGKRVPLDHLFLCRRLYHSKHSHGEELMPVVVGATVRGRNV